MEYKIGTISRFFGIPAHVLRFYERKGLLRTKRKGDSQVRYYDEYDLFILVRIKRLRGLGFTVDEVRDTILREEREELVDYYQLLSQKQNELFAEQERLTRMQRELAALKDGYRLNGKGGEGVIRQKMPEMYWIYNMNEIREEESLRMDEETSRVLMQEINPALRTMALIDGEKMTAGDREYRYEWGLAFPAAYYYRIPERARGQLFHIPATEYLVSATREEKDCILGQERIRELCERVQQESGRRPPYFLVELLPGGWTNYMAPVKKM